MKVLWILFDLVNLNIKNIYNIYIQQFYYDYHTGDIKNK
jgi:hypothetical protein